MDIEAFGKIAGLAGLALAVFLTLFRQIIAKSILSALPAETSYRFLRLAMILIWTATLFALLLWWLGPAIITVGDGNEVWSSGK
jgi:hypothetical protein